MSGTTGTGGVSTIVIDAAERALLSWMMTLLDSAEHTYAFKTKICTLSPGLMKAFVFSSCSVHIVIYLVEFLNCHQ